MVGRPLGNGVSRALSGAEEFLAVYALRSDHEKIADKAKLENVPIYVIVKLLVKDHLDEISDVSF